MVGKPVTKSRQDSQEGSVGCLRLIFRDVTQYTELVGPTFEEGLYVLILSLLRTDVTTKVLVAVCGYAHICSSENFFNCCRPIIKTLETLPGGESIMTLNESEKIFKNSERIFIYPQFPLR
jgi:hypothetical protein